MAVEWNLVYDYDLQKPSVQSRALEVVGKETASMFTSLVNHWPVLARNLFLAIPICQSYSVMPIASEVCLDLLVAVSRQLLLAVLQQVGVVCDNCGCSRWLFGGIGESCFGSIHLQEAVYSALWLSGLPLPLPWLLAGWKKSIYVVSKVASP